MALICAAGFSMVAGATVSAADGWTDTKLEISDGAAHDDFGWAVDVDTDRVVAGAPGRNGGRGAVFVFEMTVEGWTEIELTPADRDAGDRVGSAAAVDGDRIVVGAPGDDDNGDGAGAVYVFERDGDRWTATKLIAGDGYGGSVAVDEDRIGVGAPGEDGNGDDAGATYVYEPDGRGGWTETKLTAGDGARSDRFGASVTIDAERVVVGAPSDNRSRGAAYLFEADGVDGWIETKLTASDGRGADFDFGLEGDFFGGSVAIDGARIVVGAAGQSHDSGKVYTFDADGEGGWVETQLIPSTRISGASFGASVAIDGDRVALLVGTDGNDCIFGLGGDDVIHGRHGDDVLVGGPGDDHLVGGPGSDWIRGGLGVDTVDYSDSSGPVRVVINHQPDDGSFDEGDRVDPSVENVIGSRFDDELIGSAADNLLEGRRGDDLIRGRDGDDDLVGNAGADRLIGGPGDDTLRGWAGTDVCRGSSGLDAYFGCETITP